MAQNQVATTMYQDFYLEKVGEASEIPARARAGRSVRSKLTAPGQGERGWWVIHGHWEGYGRLVVTGFRTDGYPQSVRWLWLRDKVWRGPVRWAKGLPPRAEPGARTDRAPCRASLARCLRIRSTTRGSVMKETISSALRRTQNRFHLEDLTKQARPGSPPRPAGVDFPLISLLLHPGRAAARVVESRYRDARPV